MGYRHIARRGDHDVVVWLQVAFIALVAILVVTGVGVGIWSNTKTDTMTCSVTDKDRTAKPKGGSDMRVYTSDCGTLQIADSIIEGRWDSADFYAKIEKGKRYEFRTRGVRVPFFSMFPNIITAKEVPVS